MAEYLLITLTQYHNHTINDHVSNIIAEKSGFKQIGYSLYATPSEEIKTDRVDDLIEIIYIQALIQLHKELKEASEEKDLNTKMQIRNILPRLSREYATDQVIEAVTKDEELRQVQF